MKILHIAPNSPYNDYWGYQDNLLPKYQKKLGHDVAVITTNRMHSNGKIIETQCDDYVLNDGVRVIRLKYKKYINNILTGLCSRLDGIFPLLEELKPDFIFYHGLVSTTIFDAIRYKKKINSQCIIVQDNHQDYNIGMKRNSLKEKLICAWYRLINWFSVKYITKIYGVTPWRKQYAEDYFRIPEEKTDVLIMGADDEKINSSQREHLRKAIRNEYGIGDNDFLIVTGGKIDKKKGIHLLMEAVRDFTDVKLLVFGQVHEELEKDFEKLLCETPNIIYIGWLDSDKVYDYFFASDIVMFPGQHSVLWEQACAAKVPCVFERWKGMEHVNNGGNSDFFEERTVESIKEKIEQLKFTPGYEAMKEAAMSEKTDIYLYSKIAEKSLEAYSYDQKNIK